MGRYSCPLENFEHHRVHLRVVPIPHGYDPGGAYWGDGSPLYCLWYDDGACNRYEHYMRWGKGREEMKKWLGRNAIRTYR